MSQGSWPEMIISLGGSSVSVIAAKENIEWVYTVLETIFHHHWIELENTVNTNIGYIYIQ